MIKLFSYLLIIIQLFVFSGCVTTMGEYNYDFIINDLDLKKEKTNKKIIILINKNEIITKSPSSSGFVEVSMPVTIINENISKEFLSQYFTEVIVSNNLAQESFFIFDSKIVDFSYYHPSVNSTSVQIKLKVNVFKNKKMIFTKIYEKEYIESVINNHKNNVNENVIIVPFHKSLLRLYEEKVKSDLVEALKLNLYSIL